MEPYDYNPDSVAEFDGEEAAPPKPPTWWQRNQRWAKWTILGTLAVLVVVVGILLVRHNHFSKDAEVVAASDRLAAEATANAVIKADRQMAALCPKGWDDGCATALAANVPPISVPACTKATVVPVSATNTVASSVAAFVMDDDCRAATIRVKMGQIAADQSTVTRAEDMALGLKSVQEEVFAQGDAARIELLISDLRLKREVIMGHWHDPGVSMRILSHPALTPADCAQIYGVIQANGWHKAMPYLLINPNLDAGLKGMWIARPQADPAQREATILLGLHQPSVARGMIAYMVEQAIDDGNASDFQLWNILLKAAANGDLPVDNCHLEGDSTPERQTSPVCVKDPQEGTGWDYVVQMKEAQEANVSFPIPVEGWEVLRKACSWETFGGRHAAGTKGAAPLAVPKMSDVLPSNIGQ